MLNNPRYRLHCSKSGIETEITNTLETVPVAAIIEGGETLLELGINIRHRHSKHAAFRTLESNTAPHTDYAPILSTLANLTAADDSVSTLSLNRPYVLAVATQDLRLIAYLHDQHQAHLTLRAHWLVDKLREQDLTVSLARIIQKDLKRYGRALELMDEDEREKYHRQLCDAAEQDCATIESNKPKLSALRGLTKEVRRIETEYSLPLADIKTILQKRAKRIRTASPYPTRAQLNRVYDNLSVASDTPYTLPFSTVTPLSSRLHDKTHTDYHPSIQTFQLKESHDAFKERNSLL